MCFRSNVLDGKTKLWFKPCLHVAVRPGSSGFTKDKQVKTGGRAVCATAGEDPLENSNC